VVVVSHGGVMTTLWAYVAGTWEDAYAPPNCGMVLIEHGPHGYSKPQVIDGVGRAQDAGG
jgi:broad specificity phosphatase PhoE